MKLWHHRPLGPERSTYFSEQEFLSLRTAASARFRNRSSGEPVRYPGSQTLPIYVLPLAYPLPEDALQPMANLKACMVSDNVLHGYLRADVDYEHRQGHIWVAILDGDKYLPIGQTIFLAEITYPAEKPPTPTEPPPPGEFRLKLEAPVEKKKSPAGQWVDEALISKWWLFYTWILPPYRQHRIFKSSVDYFSAWHPGFILREREPHLMSALKENPEHLPQDKSIIWS